MRRKSWGTLRWLGLALLLSACARPLAPADGVEIRIGNRSTVQFDQVLVVYPARTVEYGPIAPGSLSAYHEVDGAYHYASVEISAGGETFVLQPLDFLGEGLLPPGRYTFLVSLWGLQPTVTVE